MENPRKDKGWNIETCNNRKKKKLFSSRTNLSCYKVSQSTFFEKKKTQVFKNKPVYLGISKLGLSEVVMSEF